MRTRVPDRGGRGERTLRSSNRRRLETREQAARDRRRVLQYGLL